MVDITEVTDPRRFVATGCRLLCNAQEAHQGIDICEVKDMLIGEITTVIIAFPGEFSHDERTNIVIWLDSCDCDALKQYFEQTGDWENGS